MRAASWRGLAALCLGVWACGGAAPEPRPTKAEEHFDAGEVRQAVEHAAAIRFVVVQPTPRPDLRWLMGNVRSMDVGSSDFSGV